MRKQEKWGFDAYNDQMFREIDRRLVCFRFQSRHRHRPWKDSWRGTGNFKSSLAKEVTGLDVDLGHYFS